MRNPKLILVFGALALALAGIRAADGALVLDDALQGSTTGTRSGGKFVAGGWQVTGKNDTIYWHVPTITRGAAEFDVRGLRAEGAPGRHGRQDRTVPHVRPHGRRRGRAITSAATATTRSSTSSARSAPSTRRRWTRWKSSGRSSPTTRSRTRRGSRGPRTRPITSARSGGRTARASRC